MAKWSEAATAYQQQAEKHADASIAQWAELATARLDKIWGQRRAI